MTASSGLVQCLAWRCAALILAAAAPVRAQFLPPGIPHPDNAGEDVMVDHLLDGEVIHVVWASNVDYTGNAGNDPDIFYLRFDGATWSAPVMVNAHGTLDNGAANVDQNPRLALGPDGVLHCVWESQYPLGGSGTDWDVMYSRRPAGGAWLAAELVDSGMLSDGTTADTAPNVIARANGDPLVVWQVPNLNGEETLVSAIRTGSGWTPRADLFDGLGLPWGDTFGPAALARAGNGTIVAAYATTYNLQGLAGTDLDIGYSQFPASGGWSAPAMATAGAVGDSGADRDPAVVILGSGEPGDFEIHFAWASTNDLPFGASSTGTEGDLLATVIQLPDSFPPANPAYVVNSNADGDSYPDDQPSLCVEPGGVVHAAWRTGDEFFGDLDLLRSTNATAGGDWGPFELLNLNGIGSDGDDQRVDLECGPGGGLSAMWQSTDTLLGTVGTDHDLFHALGLGRVVSRPEPINSGAETDSSNDGSPALAIGPDGVLHALWASDNPAIGGGTDADNDIFYARRDAQGWTAPQLVNTTGTSDTGGDYITAKSIVVSPDSRIHVIWSSDENIGGDSGTDVDVFYSFFDGSNWSAPELVNSDGRTDDDCDADAILAMDDHGGIQVVWTHIDKVCSPPGAYQLRWAERLASGWSPPEVFSGAAPPTGNTASFVVNAMGTAQVAWDSDGDVAGAGTDVDLFFAERVNGSWSTPELVSSWATYDADSSERDCVLLRGRESELHIVWSSMVDFGGAGPDADLFTASRSNAGWGDPKLLLSAFASDVGIAADDSWPLAALSGNTLHVVWTNQLAGTEVYAAVDLAAPLPANSTVLLANPAHKPGVDDGRKTLAVSPEGLLHYGFSSNNDLGGTIGNDGDVLHTWVRVFEPLLFADSFETPVAPSP